MNANEIRNALDGFTTEQLRKVWAAAMRVTKTNTSNYLKHGHRSEDVIGWIAAGNYAAATAALLTEIHHNAVTSVKTGRKVLSRATTSGGVDRMIDETHPDYTAANALIASILKAA